MSSNRSQLMNAVHSTQPIKLSKDAPQNCHIATQQHHDAFIVETKSPCIRHPRSLP
jgi:hypothetical protein